MVSTAARHATVRAPPASGLLVTAALCIVSAFAVATSIADLAVPALTGAAPFEGLHFLALRLGVWYLFLYIFLHNYGIGALVPGIGILAASFERTAARRRVIGWILGAAVAITILSAAELIVLQGWETNRSIMVLFAMETAGVALLAWGGIRALDGYVPTRRADWAWAVSAQKLAPFMMWSAVALAASALAETVYLYRVFGW